MKWLRTAWIGWCCLWALAWVFLGFAVPLLWAAVIPSLLMILVPVGSRGPQCPSCGQSASLHRDGRCPVRGPDGRLVPQYRPRRVTQ